MQNVGDFKEITSKNIEFFYFGKTYMMYVQLSLCCFERFHRSNARQHSSAKLHIQTGFFNWAVCFSSFNPCF